MFQEEAPLRHSSFSGQSFCNHSDKVDPAKETGKGFNEEYQEY